ncbi:MAG TPA: thioredoxin family protein [Acidobacteriaceae bacterium]|nr:thioredoxin family protein [Acidobacteriaceae bacterium]
MAISTAEVKHAKVVPAAEWLAARKAFLAKEKEFTRLRDELSRQRRELPWEKVEKAYAFEGVHGKAALADLFGKRTQLVIYHFMLGPGWAEGCKSCSYLADHFDGMTIHLANRDTAFAVVSHAPIAEIQAFQERMGWKFPWYSAFGSDFNFDYHVSFTPEQLATGKVNYNYNREEFPAEEAPGLSVFYKDDAGEVFHTYSAYARGLDILVGTYNFLDVTPKGRDEDGLAHTMAWVRHHDKYEDGYVVDPTAGWEHPKVAAPAAGQHKCCSGESHS